MRIVSLLPSATEIVYALGREPVGVSHECDHPPAASEKPAITRCRIETTGSSGSIHERVEAANDDAGLYEIDEQALLEADPDLIITQGVCEVCAVDEVLVADTVDRLSIDAETLTTDPHTLADVLSDIARIGSAIDAADRAEELVDELTRRIRGVESRVASITDRPRVVVLDWMDPPMVAGHWIPGMIDRLGGVQEFGEQGGYSAPQDWTDIRDFDPEVLIAAPCGFTVQQTIRNQAELTEREGWDSLSAVRNGRVYAMDGHHHVNRPGPRLVETFEHLAGIVHPSAFPAPDDDVSRRINPINHAHR